MPRVPLSPDHKARMQQARKTTRRDRDAALAALAANSQFTHPKLWSRVHPDVQDKVLAAIRKAQRAAKKTEIARLQAKLTKLQAEL